MSIWKEDKKASEYKSLDTNYDMDVCVIGAGITGISTAYYLTKNGFKVAVVDKDDIASKASENTTAKITLQHGLIYNYLISSYGKEFALKYFNANKDAISNIQRIIAQENINCDFEYQSNYIYAEEQENIKKIENEITAINILEDNYASFETNLNLPFKVTGAIKTKNQAQFHPIKYIEGLAKYITENGGKIFTNTCITNIKNEDKVYVSFAKEYRIKSKYVVIASHYPFINFPGFYFSKMYQVTSYAMAVDIGKDAFDGMYINLAEPTLSFRNVQYGEKKLLIVSGGNHKTGFSPESKEFYGYKFLENKINKFYPNNKILYKWNTRDCISLDKIPYIGRFSNLVPNIYVATGFKKWGMSTSHVAGKLISDSILGNKNDFAEIYKATRLEPFKNIKEFAKLHNIILDKQKIKGKYS